MVTQPSDSIATEVVVQPTSRNSSRLDNNKRSARVSGGKKKGALEEPQQPKRKVSGSRRAGGAAKPATEAAPENAPRSDEKMNSEKQEGTEAEESETVAGEESPERGPERSKSRAAVEVVQQDQDSDSEPEEDNDPPFEDNRGAVIEDPGRPQGYWGYSRPTSQMGEDTVVTPAPPAPPARSKSRMASAKDSSFWRARRVIFYKNGDPYFPGVEFRFKPGRDISTMEALLDKVSLRVELPRGARYIFSSTGGRITQLEQLEEGGAYVVSSYKVFKVSENIAVYFNNQYFITIK